MKQYGRNVSNETIINRAVRTSTVTEEISVPTGVTGMIAYLTSYGMTGTFADGEGFSLEIQSRKNNKSSLKYSTDYSDSTSFVQSIYWGNYNNIVGGDELGEVLVASIPLSREMRFRINISGTFEAEEGIDCELVVEWIS
ncbi:MAG: hypothetical protein ACQEQF_00355 [Bacillota bacterium]